jgi:hypothetical protein
MVQRADRETVIEAARFVARKLSTGNERLDEARQLAGGLASKPFSHIEETEALSRAVLLAAAQDDALKEGVRKALEGADHKQFILGGAEIVALAAIGCVALDVLVRRGQGKTTTTTTVTFEGGRAVVTTTRTTEPLSIGGELGALLSAYFKGGKG